MKNIIMLVFTIVMLLFIGGCKKDSIEETTHTDVLLDEMFDNVSKNSDVCKVCKNAQCICGVTDVPITNPDEYKDIVANKREPMDIHLVSMAIDTPPVIDGIGDDAAWQGLKDVETLDHSSQRTIFIMSCHDDDNIYFKVRFFDKTKSDTHKTWVWDQDQSIYIQSNDREDCLALKWKTSGGNMSYHPDKAEPHTADVWFWKARRTNPAGYFDDKHQVVSESESDKAFAFPSDKYGTLYLTRSGDSGRSAYEEKMYFENIGPAVHKYYPREPQGSRADIRAKGIWNNNYWTIEFARKLDTGNEDDIVISKDKECQFGICLYEMAATGIEPSWTQPLYRTGDIFDTLILTLE